MLDAENVKVIDLLRDLMIKDPSVPLSIGSVVGVSVDPTELAIVPTLSEAEDRKTCYE